jgi:hypothetical protein
LRQAILKGDARPVSSAQTLDRKLLAAAFLRAQELVALAQPVDAGEALRAEEALRPLASAKEIRHVVVPLLDLAGLTGLAAAWDTGPEAQQEAWMIARVERFAKLGAPEFGFICLCEMNRGNPAVEAAHQQALAALAFERSQRTPTLAGNLNALAEFDVELADILHKTHRTSVALRPAGTGLAEFAGLGQSWVQLWAVTANAALQDARRLIAQCSVYSDGIIAGVGDGSLPVAAGQWSGGKIQRLHVVELQAARVRALLEVADLSPALRTGRLRLHVGTRALKTLAPFAPRALAQEGSVVGGDQVSISLLRASAQPGIEEPA